MRRIRGKDTRPELRVRRVLRELKVGYRLHAENLAGRPDIVMKGRRMVLFVHGCFWHRHKGCHRAFVPKTRSDWWAAKFERNVERDKQAQASLEAAGWRVCVVWECETRDLESLKTSLAERIFGNEGEA
ncbi:DNA mismatch endonuclease Vsr [Rhizobium leguminosarum bv. viciae]|nr:DNA mismatch endonuclease Vsr [Rhizobium leguminosarum bv. viciae]